MKKTHLLAGGGILAAAAVLAALLLGGPGEKAPTLSGQQPAVTRPPVTEPVQTGPSEPVETAVPETTQPPIWTEPEQTAAETFPTEPAQTVPAEPTEEPLPELFPMELDGLTVHAMFPYSGMNPDAGLEFGEEIAGLQVTNTSDRHLELAELTAVLDDGTELIFRVEELPAGMSAMIFEPENRTLPEGWRCAELDGFAEFREEDPIPSGLVTVSAEGIAITVQNVSGVDLTDLRVICHGLLDGSCFGGTIYTYEIPSLSAGESTVIQAVDCILGMAQAVRVELGD